MKKYLFLFVLSLCIFSCSNEESDIRGTNNNAGTKKPSNVPLDSKYVEPGVFRIKLTSEAEAQMDIKVSGNGLVTTGLESLDLLCREMNVTRIKRTFRHGGRHEEKMRNAGLHLWYDIYFDMQGGEGVEFTRSMTRMQNGARRIPEAIIVEPVLKIKRIKTGRSFIPDTRAMEELLPVQPLTAITSSELPKINIEEKFNDPYLKYQWHYHNEGLLKGSIPAADINLLKAWEIETGKPQVIVAVIDGGIDTDHPDLRPNLWMNEAELNGIEGKDDNGDFDPNYEGKSEYIDDIYGYNFALDQGKITGHEHGTHIAGTVAAVSNNGIGGAGVAGGNGSKDSGVRMMSCQIFAYDEEGNEISAENKHEAFVYAANNGAVIAQNSWAYTVDESQIDPNIAQADKDAIDYFIQNAGIDEEGNQVGPMRGGIVIFAAGNANTSTGIFPAAYENVFSVASYSADYVRAGYSNYGDWVEVAAPGGSGDYSAGTQVFSTFMHNNYGYQEGTSMACPHVSGIAALVVSKFGVNDDGTIIKGFTNEELKKRLLDATNDYISWYSSPAYPIGKGYMNAYKALAEQGSLAPDRVSDLRLHWVADKVNLKWRVTADSDDVTGKAEGYRIFINEENLYGLDFAGLTTGYETILTGENAIGETLSFDFDNLKNETAYYISIAAFDREGNISLSSTYKGFTVPNNAPVLVGLPELISLRKNEVKEILLTVSDHEGDAWDFNFKTENQVAAMTGRDNNQLLLTLDARKAMPGQSFEDILTLTDEQGGKSETTICYTIVNNAPHLLQSFEDIAFQYLGEEKVYDLTRYFIETDGDEMAYTITSSNETVAATALTSNSLKVTAAGVGTSVITIIAKDPYGEQTGVSFDVISRDENRDMDLYPVPVRKDGLLNIRMGRFVTGTIDVTLYATSGAKVYNQKVNMAPGISSQINISNLKTGNYKVTVKYKQQEFTRNITKL